MATLHVVVLTYIKPISEVDAHIPAHIEWLNKGYDDGVFLASGRRVPRIGGVILATGELDALQARLQDDPFHRFGVASVEVIPFDASKRVAALEGIF